LHSVTPSNKSVENHHSTARWNAEFSQLGCCVSLFQSTSHAQDQTVMSNTQCHQRVSVLCHCLIKNSCCWSRDSSLPGKVCCSWIWCSAELRNNVGVKRSQNPQQEVRNVHVQVLLQGNCVRAHAKEDSKCPVGLNWARRNKKRNHGVCNALSSDVISIWLRVV